MINQLMTQLLKKKELYFLDLSWNNMVDHRETGLKSEIFNFVMLMRRLILKSKIFHLNLSGMQLGANVHKLTEVITASTTLAVVHLSDNSVLQGQIC